LFPESARTKALHKILLSYRDPSLAKSIVDKIKDRIKAARFANLLKSRGMILEEIDEYSFYEYLLPGMVYYSAGRIYRSESFKTVGNITFVFVRPEHSKKIETHPISYEEVKILEKQFCKDFKDWKICLGKIKVKKTYVGYLEKYKAGDYTRQSIHYYDNPVEREFITSAIWIILPGNYREIEKAYYEYFKRKLEIYIKKKKYITQS